MDVLQVACGSGASGCGLLQSQRGDPSGAAFGEAGVWASQVRGQDCGFPLCKPLSSL